MSCFYGKHGTFPSHLEHAEISFPYPQLFSLLCMI